MLCNNFVNFVIKNDRKKAFKFTALQWSAGKKILRNEGLSQIAGSSIILIENHKKYTKSTAVLRILKKLPLPYYILYVFIIIPPFIRNPIYSLFSKKRYKWFGKKDSCMMPGTELADRFLMD